jgi:hypothetical protein
MELLERYLNAVRFWLPTGQQEDILAELASDLRSQIEEGEAQLGRPLVEAELASLLQRRGHPLRVAGQYLSPQPWMDPVMSLLFQFVLKVVLLWVLTPLYALILLSALVFSASPLAALGARMAGFLNGYLYAVGLITVVFAAIATLQSRSGPKRERDWDPRRLPKARGAWHQRPISRGSSVVEIVLGLVFLVGWIPGPSGAPMAWSLRQAGLAWTPDGFWTHFHGDFFWPVVLMVSAGIVMGALGLLRPTWTRLRLGIRAAIDGLSTLLLGLLLVAHRSELRALLDLVRSLGHHPRGADVIGLGLDLSLASWLAIAALISLVSCLVRLGLLLSWRGKQDLG